MQSRRVVITGMGAVTPLGNDVATFWRGIKEGRSGIGLTTKIDIREYPSKIAGEVRDFDPTDFMDKKTARKIALFAQYAMAATVQAMQEAGLSQESIPRDRSAVILGNGIGGFETIEASHRILFDKGPSRIPPLTIPKIISNEGPGTIAMQFAVHGPAYTVTTACASGTDAIGHAFHAIREGRSDLVISGGTEACITGLGVGGFSALKALSTARNDDPQSASRPFDKDRDGFVIAEGAGILVLEELSHAQERGAVILAEIAGYGATSDAYHLTAPDPEGSGASKAMHFALADAAMKPQDIDYINAHGTSTPTNDPIESKAIGNTFGAHAEAVRVSSTKGLTGHLIGAAGAVEAIAGVMGLRDGFYPGTANLEEPGEGCDLNYVKGRGEEKDMKAFMSNSLGFGGHNSVIIMKEYRQ
jgi:3-oxoacyl-[acyl-carrier-protein] synthase II